MSRNRCCLEAADAVMSLEDFYLFIYFNKHLKIMDIFKQLCWYNHPHINTKDTAPHGLE